LIRRAAALGVLTLGVVARIACPQAAVSGQASAFLTSNPDTGLLSQAGLRYIPDVALQRPLGGGDSLALDLSLDALLAGSFGRGAQPAWDASLKPYRAWLRFATHTFEARVGLQKINFGSATLFRPLMWFDRVDPRDPLQITNGVTGALARYYFPNNTNVWAWALVGNTATKGWETFPTGHGTFEAGGRFQTPVPAGEVGLTYDHRDANLAALPGGGSVPEDRFGLDGKWNLGFGLWGEGALVHERTTLVPGYQRFWTLGADYTIGVGNGLYVLAEHSRFDAAATAFGSGRGASLSGLMMNYPLGILDRVSAIVYANWTQSQWYRILTWQRTYDVWTFYLLLFWNPRQPLALGVQQQTTAFAGRGLQIMATFNH
jgi:hypothetical protein